jgi:hypothetical protein
MFYNTAIEIEEKISLSLHFQRYVLNKEYANIYKTLLSHPELAELHLFSELEREVDYHFRKCEVFVSKGDIESITHVVKDFYSIPLFSEKIRSFYTSAYSTQFMVELTASNPTSQALNASVSHYLSLFGLDDTITLIVEHIKRRTGFKVDLQGTKPRYDTLDFTSIKLPDFII